MIVGDEQYEKIKAKVGFLLAKGKDIDGYHVGFLDSSEGAGNPDMVSAYVMAFPEEIRRCGQSCQAGLMYGVHCYAIGNYIMGGDRPEKVYDQTREESVRYLQYLMDHPLFKGVFFEHDAEKAMDERIMVHDMTKLPANQTMFAITAIRSLWERPFNRTPRRFCKLVDAGLKPDAAYILAHYFVPKDDGFTLEMPQSNQNHACISYASFSEADFTNYLRHKMVRLAKGTITSGAPYFDRKTYSINSLFSNNYSDTSTRGGTVSLESILTKKYSHNYSGKIVSVEEMIELGERYA